MLDDRTIDDIAAGVYPPTDQEARALAAEVLRLRAERDELRAACDDLHVDVARARDALDDMRARAEKAEAERDAIRAAAVEYARSHARKGGDQ